MIKPLKRIKRELYHFVDGKKIDGVHDAIRGDVSYIRGDVSDIPMDRRGEDFNLEDWIE
jgi:hypothetical protein